MIISEKFVAPDELPLKELEKPYFHRSDYENDWNLPQFASSKISKFYHDINQRFMESPNSPTMLNFQQIAEMDKIRSATVDKHKASAKRRLNNRMMERQELEDYCKMSVNNRNTPLPRITRIRMNSQMSYNTCDAAREYHKYENLPKRALKIVFPEKIARIEANAMLNVIQKTQELNKLENWRCEKVREAVNKQREKLKKKHKRTEELENKSSIFKFREGKVNDFGFEKIYKTSEMFDRLSQPKKIDNFLFTKSDLRGLVNYTPDASNDTSCNHTLLTEFKSRRGST